METTLDYKEAKGTELIQELITKSWESTSFKEQLINNPKETIESVAGVKGNPNKAVNFVVEDQSDPSIVYFNIPAQPKLENLELTQEELDLVAGGTPLNDLGHWIGSGIREGAIAAWDYIFG